MRIEPTEARRPIPTPARAAGAALDGSALAAALRARVRGEVRFDPGSRALYATDSSNYRQTPIGVVVPRTIDDVVETVAVCRQFGAPLLSRGGGTSLAGQCCNVAVVIDWSKHLHGILDIDPASKTATVLPGTVLDHLRGRATRLYQLTLGPDPSTHDRCTIGGMIGNNSCGTHAQMAGKMSNNVHELEILTYDGVRMWVGPTTDEDYAAILRAGGRRADIYRRLRALRDTYADEIRARYPRIPRRVSGYNLDWLLPENDFDLARALVGTEGTCATVLQAKVRLMHNPPHRALLVVGYPSIYEAGDHVPELLELSPIAFEAIDQRLKDRAVKTGAHAQYIPELPPGKGLLVLEFGGDTQEEASGRAHEARRLVEGRPGVVSSKVFDHPTDQDHIWKVREAGLGATARVPGEPDTWPGWEDSAVAPAKVGGYLRDLRKLFDRYGYDPAVYGHFGQGCIHCRIDFDLTHREGRDRYRRFMDEATDLCVSYGGSFSGEHGDGQSRAQFLPKMFGERLMGAFREFKSIWDPEWKMNPGKVVDPNPTDANLRLVAPAWMPKTHFAYAQDQGRFDRAVLRCVGVGLCRRHEGGTMCPSYMVTREEMHSTRGRAHLLFEMLQGKVLRDRWRDPAVKESLDLCLACKGCTGECPVKVDIPTYKAEFLSHYYQGRLRPRAAYAMGLVMYWMRLARLSPSLANVVLQTPPLQDVARLLGGIDPRRPIPRLAKVPFQRWMQGRPAHGPGRRVVLWPDTFNNYFYPQTARAGVEVLEEAGYHVVVPQGFVCCGRPLYDFGMLPTAKAMLRRTIDILDPLVADGTPIVGLEPSCASVFRDEMVKLFPDDPRAQRIARQVTMFGDFLENEQIDLPPLPVDAVVHGHCHHKTVLDFGGEEKVLKRLGVRYNLPDTGCCGMAGAFGFETGTKYDVAMACGERVLLPAVRSTPKQALVIADGFSCRQQIQDTTDRKAVHLAEVVRFAQRRVGQVQAGPLPPYPERHALDGVLSPLRGRRGSLWRRLAPAGAVAGGAWLLARAWPGDRRLR